MVSPFIKQAWTVSGVLLNMLGHGMLLSYTSVLLPAIQGPNSEIPTDLYTASWIASIIGTAGLPGFCIASVLMDVCGRKIAHAIVVVPGILGWICVYYATSVPVLLTGRALGGIAAAAGLGLGSVVIGEYSSPKSRGMFLNLKTAAVSFGNLLVHTLGNFYSWRAVALVAIIPHSVALIITLTWPESPAWLALKRQFKKSEKSFFWLRGESEDSVQEIRALIQAQEERLSKLPKATSFSSSIVEFLMKFTKKDFIKPCIIVTLCAILLDACGRHIFPAFASKIVAEVSGGSTNSFYYTLGIDIITTLSALFSSFLVKIWKRRTLLFSTGFMALSVLFTVCLYLYLVAKDLISKERNMIPMSLLVLYFTLSNLGCTPISLALLGEVFPLAHRGAGSGVIGFVMSFCMMVTMQAAPFLLVSVKVHGTFAIFGIVMGLCLIALWFVLPETKDRTLQEIEDYFNYGEFKSKKDDEDEVNVTMIGKNVADKEM